MTQFSSHHLLLLCVYMVVIYVYNIETIHSYLYSWLVLELEMHVCVA